MRRASLAIAAAAGLLGNPALAAPCAGFTDLDTTSPFCADVAWIRNRGVTLGCTAIRYCPNDSVSRLQMAAFMHRLGDALFPATCAAGQVMKWNGTAWACAADSAGPAGAFVQSGNAFGATAILGTTDARPLELVTGNARAMRFEPNATSPNVIGGSAANYVIPGVRGGTIGGGGVPLGDTDPLFGSEAPNRVTDAYGTVSGGYANRAGNAAGTIKGTTTDGAFATVGGGWLNTASGQGSTVAGGESNDASGANSAVAGGAGNTASGTSSAIGGGALNTASGRGSMVPGGSFNSATGDYSFAAGFKARATTKGTFMWADSTDRDFVPSVDNFFGARATGGVGFTVAVDPITGASTQYCNYLPGYSGWLCISDRDAKENFVAANGDEILEKLVAMPLFSWNYKGADPTLRMLGPTAQDFHAAFALGGAGRTIASGNLDGVALAAIQGLNAKLEAKLAARDAELTDLRAELASLRALLIARIAQTD